MSKQYPGGLITKNPVTPSGPYENSTASGIWTLDQQAYWRKLGQWPTAGNPAPDAQFNYVTMLLHGDGTNGAQNNTFLDSSTNNFTITRNGNTTQGSFSPYGSNWSNFFDGSDDYFTSTGVNLSTGDVTFEFWIYPSDETVTYRCVYDTRIPGGSATSGFGVFQYGKVIEVYQASLVVSSAANSIAINAWNHVALVRNSGTCQLYVNGVASGSSNSNTTNLNSTDRRIGNATTAAYYYFGYISNLREVTSALYTGTFTPSTTPLTAISGTSLLTCQSNRFIDNSTNAFAITVNGNPSVQRFNPFGASTAYSTSVIGGSGYFDGSGDYLSVADSASLELGSSDFCIEGWYFPQSFSANLALVSKRTNTTSTGAVVIYANSGSGALTFYASTNGSSYFWSGTTVGTMVLNQWNHFAVYRSGNNWYGAMNGVVSSMGSNASSIYNNTDAWTIGGDTDGNYANGYIASSRIVIGSAVYGASNFTPPTAPLTAITNTSLLLAYTNGAIFDNAMMNDLETVGNAQISTSVKKYGTGSLAFDGTGDYLQLKDTPNFIFGTGDFTIEGWIYLTSSGTFRHIYDQRPTSTDGAYPTVRMNESNAMEYVQGAAVRITSSTLSQSIWYYFAVARSGTSTKLFINGTQSGSTYTDSTDYLCGANRPFVGGSGYHVTTVSMNGYIDDLRITKGFARYTSNFTAPTAAFPNIGPT